MHRLIHKRQAAEKHIEAWCETVLISAPGTDLDATVVFGVNDHIFTPEHRLISNASCTTNCLAPVSLFLNIPSVLNQDLQPLFTLTPMIKF